MKLYEVVILMLLLISLSVVLLKGNIRTQHALEDFRKCKIILDHDCLEYGNCRCR